MPPVVPINTFQTTPCSGVCFWVQITTCQHIPHIFFCGSIEMAELKWVTFKCFYIIDVMLLNILFLDNNLFSFLTFFTFLIFLKKWNSSNVAKDFWVYSTNGQRSWSNEIFQVKIIVLNKNKQCCCMFSAYTNTKLWVYQIL